MKVIIDSSDKMRDAWASLVQVEDGDKAVRMTADGRDWWQTWPAGYSEVSDSFVKKLLKMDSIEEAYQAMRRYTAP